MKIFYTGPVEQITDRQLISWSKNPFGDDGTRKFGSFVSRKHLKQFPEYYGNLDSSKQPINRGACFRANMLPVSATAFTNGRRHHLFMNAMSRFFLGEHRKMARQDPSLNGLPFYTFLSYATNLGILMPPVVVERTIADFLNVASDGTERDFLDYVHIEYPDENLGSLYLHIKNAFTDILVRENGSFYFTMDY